ncbi:MAG: HIT family protein [Proteobacteria bacterium]|nr:HIT family protein [Pseudomonadota bacterium]HQR03511.1 HIT family protein [Rhodocyclaceae bacterium]
MSSTCPLCANPDDPVLWQDADCRIVRVSGAEGAAFPGFCRVLWRRHVREMGDLAAQERNHLMQVVFATELAVREVMRPDKINLASLGNVVPHLHWHVIPRWHDDSHFPTPIWGPARRRAPTRELASDQALQAVLHRQLGYGP